MRAEASLSVAAGVSPPLALSPWYGVVELVSLPGIDSDDRFIGPNVEVWDGDHYSLLVAETLRPLTSLAARMLGRRYGDPVWDEAKKRAWEREPLRFPFP